VQKQIRFEHADTLVDRNFGSVAVDHNKPEIAIVSAGAHIYGGTIFKNVTRETIMGMKKYPNTTFVWKTVGPGGCTPEISFPSDSATEFNFSGVDKSYGHADFYERDLYVLSLLQKYGMSYLDMRALYSRSDAHPGSLSGQIDGDCLHMCSPGPLDILLPCFSVWLVRFDNRNIETLLLLLSIERTLYSCPRFSGSQKEKRRVLYYYLQWI
jgi:hypothetical protein